jgi:hypothetical protein
MQRNKATVTLAFSNGRDQLNNSELPSTISVDFYWSSTTAIMKCDEPCLRSRTPTTGRTYRVPISAPRSEGPFQRRVRLSQRQATGAWALGSTSLFHSHTEFLHRHTSSWLRQPKNALVGIWSPLYSLAERSSKMGQKSSLSRFLS